MALGAGFLFRDRQSIDPWPTLKQWAVLAMGVISGFPLEASFCHREYAEIGHTLPLVALRWHVSKLNAAILILVLILTTAVFIDATSHPLNQFGLSVAHTYKWGVLGIGLLVSLFFGHEFLDACEYELHWQRKERQDCPEHLSVGGGFIFVHPAALHLQQEALQELTTRCCLQPEDRESIRIMATE